MNSSDVVYHFDEADRMIIAERAGHAVGMLPWTVSGQIVHLYQLQSGDRLLFTCVAPHERNRGIGTQMATLMRERFPREDGWQTRTSDAITPALAAHVYDGETSLIRDEWFDFTGEPNTPDYPTVEVTNALEIAQRNLDRILADNETLDESV